MITYWTINGQDLKQYLLNHIYEPESY